VNLPWVNLLLLPLVVSQASPTPACTKMSWLDETHGRVVTVVSCPGEKPHVTSAPVVVK
jgi:hypothetical protein